ncbi:tandem-95 repeat protein [Pirellulaceae bacterium SH449]
MGIDASKLSSRIKSLVEAKRKKFRRLMCESLERRELLAVFAPGTPQSYIDSWNSANPILQARGNWREGLTSPIGGAGFNAPGDRWTVPTGGASPNEGNPATVSWSIVPDGTPIGTPGDLQSSNLIAFLDGIYGTAPGPVGNRPWFRIIENAYNSWSDISGLQFVYEPNDDGAAYSFTSRGIVGVRGDIRVGGRTVDGNFGVLAYNFFPSNGGASGFDGNMVIDTSDIWYSQNADGPNGENRGFFNVLMHEIGHGIGLDHSYPINQTKLLEPFVSLQFIGAQHDDILGAQTLYGDRFSGNNSTSTATNLGSLENGVVNLDGLSIHRNESDDFFRFRIEAPGRVSVRLNPVGFEYVVGNQANSTSQTNSLIYKDLSFQILTEAGDVLASVNSTGPGGIEQINDLQLPSAGNYFVRVSGAGSQTQLYNMRLTLSGITTGTNQETFRLLSVAPNSGDIFSFNQLNVLDVAPTELVLRFDDFIDTNDLSGIELWAAGKDGEFGTANDYQVTPGWIGAGDNSRVIIMRFAETLKDDLYQVRIRTTGPNALRNMSGLAIAPREFDSTIDDLTVNTVDFRLQLGAQILGVVPQPVDRLPNGTLNPRLDIIRVYFNDDDLFETAVSTGDITPNPTVVDPAYYQLVFTADTIQPHDDQRFLPTTIHYDPQTNMAELRFAAPIHSLVPGGGTFRLRIGSRDVVKSTLNPPNVTLLTENTFPGGEVGSTVTGAGQIGPFVGSREFIISGSIITTSPNVLPLPFPGSNFEPGHRDIQDESHLDGQGDTNPQISTVLYNFALNRSYGNDSAGRPLFTTITPEQILRVREIFDLYSRQMGIDFIESESDGLTIVVGDLFPLTGVSGGGVAGIAGGGLAIMDSGQNWDNSFGAGFFDTAMHEIGHLLGLGHTYDLPNNTNMGSESELSIPSDPQTWSFPGDHDVTHGLHLYRRDNRDVDMYRFVVPAGEKGNLRLEILAERLATSSNLDAHLTLFKRGADGVVQVVSANSRSFGLDPFIEIEIEASASDTEYFIAVTAIGNEDFNPQVANTGSGGFSQGEYQLRIHFQSTLAQTTPLTIQDVDGTPIDGDGDGIAGGDFNFWFRAVAPSTGGVPTQPRTIFVDKAYSGAISNGSPSQPMTNLNFASWPLQFRPQPGDIVRVAGFEGVADLTEIPAYEFGRGGVGNQVLADGLTLQVPRGVTLMVDAGAIFKLQGSQISTGSQTAAVDNSLSALQVLGTPQTPVFFTSYRDESLGLDTNPLSTTPNSGDWGGLFLRGDIDIAQGRANWERHGIFLNYIAGANIRFGGGQVTVLTGSPSRNAISMQSTRPTVLNNNLILNASAAMSATPNSFEHSRFVTPKYQMGGAFTPDYDRQGPEIRGNRLIDNSVNGLLIKTETLPGQPLTTLDVPAVLKSTDIVYVLAENLIISGQPGGNILDTVGPDVSLIATQNVAATNSTLVAGSQVRYKVTFVDRWGNQGMPSAATVPHTVIAGNAVQISSLPAVSGDFQSRRLWRSLDGINYSLVAELDGATSTFVDRGVTQTPVLANPNATSAIRGRIDSRLQIAPGAIVKATGSRIEVGFGGQLIAEGTADRPIIFTSRSDDRYGAGGTFDTYNDGISTNPGAGDWGGLIARHLSSISVDNAVISFGGGVSSVPGGFAGFNPVEIHQAAGRIANTRFELNGSGTGGNVGPTREGRGPNDATVIYVVGSQPVIVNNTFRGNSIGQTAAISINANALNSVNVLDHGRQTGLNNRVSSSISNVGPLVRDNAMIETALNGKRVRGQVLTTESIWDDTDIVHILQSVIVVPDFHTYGGLTLKSRVDEGLVVKLGTGAGFTALGRPLDITDRIGGSFRVLGTPGFPVVLTSLADDTVGAGFDPNGRPLLDTNNNGPSTGTPGSWRSIRFEPYANDRNVAKVVELETDMLQDEGTNDDVNVAQELGRLATHPMGGDENLRLGFEVDGTIATPSDLDVYRFLGTAGTQVWFDIDRTSGSLDAVLEFLDEDGNILAQSNSSLLESRGLAQRFVSSDTTKILPAQVNGLDANFHAPRNPFDANIATDFHSVNPHDPGMRIVLPGTPGEPTTYYVRVRSSNSPSGSNPATTPALQDPALLRAGLSMGNYRLQVRLSQTNEVPGSVVQYADIRFSTNGIEARGMPGSSPLLGQTAESVDARGSLDGSVATSLGNIANSDRGSISVAGQLIAQNDIDSYTFSISRDSVQASGGYHVAVIFDIDYADGFGGPDTSLWVFRIDGGTEQLVYVGTGSNIADDQPSPLRGNDVTDLTRGSAGTRDAYIGPVELPEGNYRVVVTNSRLVPQTLEQFTLATTDSDLTRLEPVNSVRRLAIHRFNPLGDAETNSQAAVTQVLFDANPGNQRVEWNLSDILSYVVRDFGTGSRLSFANPMTGARIAEVSEFVRVNDAAMGPDGRLVGYQVQTTAVTNDANGGNFVVLNSVGALNSDAVPTGASTQEGTSGIQTFTTQRTDAFTANPTFAIQQRDHDGPGNGNQPIGDGIVFNGLSFYLNDPGQVKLFGVGSRGNNQTSFGFPVFDENGNVAGVNPAQRNFNTTNIVYRLDPFTGTAINPQGVADRDGNARVNGAGTNRVEFGRFLSGTEANNFTDGRVSGLAAIGNVLYAVSNLGEFFVAPLGANGNTGFASNFVSTNPAAVYSGRLPTATIIDPETNAPVVFEGLTAGPRNLQGGAFANLLFGITANGTLYAFNTNGQLQPVFPGFSYKVQTTTPSRALGGGIKGIDFSPLDINLWHLSDLRAGEPGSGRPPAPDGSQTGNEPGDRNLYFGFRDTGAVTRQQGQWNQLYDGFYNQTYNLPGGAHGALLTKPIDLRNFSADDLPMLYFNYLIDSENQNSDLQQDGAMRDAFRVYGAGEDGQWVLLATNNTASDQGLVRDGRNGATDELDNAVNGNFDSFGNPLISQELFDQSGWRQARIPLGALAGRNNVRLRFEFSTAGSFGTGDPLLGGMELTAIAGNRIVDGTGFVLGDVEVLPNITNPADALAFFNTANPRRFEFDLGLVLSLPSGASIQDGVSSINGIGASLVFSTTTDDANTILYSVNDSPAQLAQRVVNALTNKRGIAAARISTDPARLNVIAVADLPAGTYSVTSLLATVIQGLPGRTAANWPIPGAAPLTIPIVAVPVRLDMTPNQVGAEMRRAFATVYSNPDMLAAAGPTAIDQATAAWPHHENIVRLYRRMAVPVTGGLDPSFNNSGIGITVSRVGDVFGADLNNPSRSQLAHMDERALNNNFQGIFIDDIIIGFAERGEMVFNANTLALNSPFVPNREYAGNLYADLPVIDTGRYQLTVRTAAEYGTSEGTGLLGGGGSGSLSLLGPDGRDFDTNDRLSRTLGIEVNANAAGNISDGTTFTLTDTSRSVTFEFDVTSGPGDIAAGVVPGNVPISISTQFTPEQIATAIRNAINSPTVQSLINVRASIRGQSQGSAISNNSRFIELHGPVSTNLAGGFSFTANTFLSTIVWGSETDFGEDLGDSERLRPQGQLLLVGNTITNASGYGIVTEAGTRSQPFGTVGPRPYPGSPINYPTINSQRLAPGAVIMNNVLANNGAGGVRISGDPAIDATVQIARVINNTFFSGTDGVLIEGGASPTILNNIFSSTGTAVRAVGGTTAVLGANLFQSNTTNFTGVTPGEFNILLGPAEPLFVSTTNRRFYLAAGSRAIDASLEALQERAALSQVKNPLGLPLSPMIAPDRDVNGLLRVDDPAVPSASGLGANVFKDRGAVERADFVAPVAVLLQPQDNDAAGVDQDRSVTYIRLDDGRLDFFSILLEDINGTGPDPATVVASAITLTENGRVLREGSDYVLGYNANSRILRLTPLAGIWRNDSVYEITLNNQVGRRVAVPSGASIVEGSTLTVAAPGGSIVFEFDNDGTTIPGNIPLEYTAFSSGYELAAKISYEINRRGIAGLASRVEGSGRIVVTGSSAITSSTGSTVSVTNINPIRDLAGNILAPNRANALTQFTIVMPAAQLDFGDIQRPNIPTLEGNARNGARHVILPVDERRLALGTWSAPDLEGIPTAAADGDDNNTIFNLGTLGGLGGVVQGPAGAARLAFPPAAFLDGQTVTITDGINRPLTPVTFEFDTDGITTGDPNTFVVVLLPSDDATQVAQAFRDAVWQAILAGRLTGLVPVQDGTEVSLGGGSQHLVDLVNAPNVIRLSVGNVDMVVPTDTSTLADGQSFSITDSVGRTLVFEINDLSSANPIVSAGSIAIDVDLSVNTAEQVALAIASAVQQQISIGNIWLGRAFAAGSTVSIIGDDEDGIRFIGEFNSRSNPVRVQILSTGFGMLDAWIDWNGNGGFSAAERVVFLETPTTNNTVATSIPIVPGLNEFYIRTPLNAVVGVTTARFRLSTTGGLLVNGVGIGGEVEDYLIEILDGSPPVAVNDSYQVNEDELLMVSMIGNGVLSNDTDLDSLPLAPMPGVNIWVHDEDPTTPGIEPLVDVQFGTLILLADGRFTYTPDLDFNGIDFFVYRATDGRLISNEPATVTITVNPINDDPVAFDDTITMLEDATLAESGMTFTANDFPHFRMADPAFAGGFNLNESGQVLTVVGTEIVTEIVSDLGISGTEVRIASKVGQGIYGIRVRVETSDLGLGALPVVSVPNPSTIRVTLNSHAASPSTIQQMVDAILANSAASALVDVSVLSSNGAEVIGTAVPDYSPILVPPRGGDVNVVDNVVTYTPPLHYNNLIGGPAIVRLTIADDGTAGPVAGLTATSTLTINITPLNDRPSFTLDQTLIDEIEDPVPALRSYEIVRDITPGPDQATDELESQLVDRFEIRVLANHPDPESLFNVLPHIVGAPTDTIRRLEYVLAPDVNWIIAGGDLFNTDGLGDIVLEIVAFDDGPTSPAGNVNESLVQRVTIRIEPVNDAPEFTLPATHISQEDAGVITVPGFVTDIRAGTTTATDELLGSPTHDIPPQQVQFEIVFWDENLFVSIPTITPDGTLEYQIRPDINRNYYNTVGVAGVTPVIDPVVRVRLVDDGRSDGPNVNTSAVQAFTVIVTPVNDPPVPGDLTLASVEDIPLEVDASQLTSIARSGPIDEDLVELQEIRLTSIQLVTAQGGTIVPVFADDDSRILTFTYIPPQDYFGLDTVEYVITDNGTDDGELNELSATGVLTFNVVPVNDPPSFTPGEDVVLNEDAPAFVIQWATDILPGPPNEADQTVSFEISVVNSTLFAPFFSVAPEIDSTGVLTFTLAQDVNGTVLLEIVAVDSGPSGGPNNDNNRSSVHTLTLTVNAVNDVPLFTLDQDLVEHIEDPTPALVQLPIISGVFPSRSTALDELLEQTVSFELTVVSAVPDRFVIPPRIVGTGTSRVLEYQLAPDVNRLNSGGDIFVDIVAVDSGLGDDPNVNTSGIVRLTLRITEVNDPPEFDILFNTITIQEDAPLQFLPAFYFNERPGPATAVDELDQTITRTVSVPAGAEVLYSVLPRLNSGGDLEFQFAPDVNSNFAAIFGIANAFEIFITATDDGQENGVTIPRSTTQTLTVNVTPVNDPPAFNLSQNQVVILEDAGQVSFNNFALNVRPATNATALDEVDQLLTFDLTFSNPALFSVVPTIDSSGRLSFQTAPDRNGTSVVTARLRDNGLAGPPPNSNLGPLLTFTISVTPVNDAPEFTIPSSLTVLEDQGVVSVPGFATGIRPGPETAIDENNQVLTFVLEYADPAVFEVLPSLQTDGTLTFRTRLDVNSNTPGINPVVRFRLRDNGPSDAPNINISTERSFTLNITPVNDPPIPGSIRIPGVEDVVLEVGPGREFDIDDILATVVPGPIDEIIEGQTVRMTQIERTTQRGGQILPVFENGVIVSFRYVPPTNLAGDDFVRYVVTDNGNPEASATGTITFGVAPINDPPQFTAGPNISLLEDAPAFSQPWATNILAGPPSALDEISGPNAQTVSFEVRALTTSFFAVQPAVSPAGVLSFTLARDVNGTTVVEVIAVDSGPGDAPNNNRSTVHRLTINVAAVNDPPGFVLGPNITIAEDSGPFDEQFVSNIVPAEGLNNNPPTGQDELGQTVTFIVTNSNNNLFSVQPTITPAGRLRFVPAPNAFGAVTVTVIAQDSGPSTPPNQNQSSPVTFQIMITPVNDPPFAVNDRYETTEDDVLTVAAPGVLGNDIDPDLPDDVLVVAEPGTLQSNLGAVVVLNADGSFTYDPRNSARIQGLTTGQTDVDTFTYRVRDRSGLLSNLGTVSITLTGINDAPVAVDDRFVVATGVPVILSILDNDFDVDTPIDVGSVTIGILPLNGTVNVLPSGRVQYTPRAGFVGEDTFSYRVRDSLGAQSNEAIVQVVSGISPIAADDFATTTRNVPIDINLVLNDVSFTGGLNFNSLQIASGPDTGTVTILGDGIVRYTPATDFVGIGSFQYFLSDTDGIPSNLATVTVRIVSSLNQNPSNRFDVDNDGFVSPIDVLILINELNLNGSRILPPSAPRPPFLDVDGDGTISPLDVLQVINFINERVGSGTGLGEGEGEGMESLGWFDTVQIMSPQRFVEVCEAEFNRQVEREIGKYLTLGLADSLNMGPHPYAGSSEDQESDSFEDMLAFVADLEEEPANVLDDLFARDWS